MKFKVGEIILVRGGEQGYIPRKVAYHNADGTYLLGEGFYNVVYNERDMHKCPTTIKKIYLRR